MSTLLQRTQRPAAEKEPFEDLYRQYNRLVYARFLRHGFSDEDARDLLHKTFLQAFRGWQGFRGDSAPKTWLISIADRIALNVFRDRGRLKNQAHLISIEASQDTERQRPLAETLEAPDEQNSPLKRLMLQERDELLWQALCQLPPQMRQITTLRLKYDYKYQEIADILQVSLNTVRSELHQARHRLRATLAETFGDIQF